jgi:glutamyl-tRNA reductase
VRSDMAILALGVSYRRAPIELLERLAFADDDFPKAYRRLLELEAVTEGAILSTCNRVEVYAEVSSYHAGFLDLKRFLAESREVAPEEFAEPLYSHYEDDAAEHLFRVAAGLDSMVLGEPQILSQVRAAHRMAQQEGAFGPTLSALFRGAIRTGRRARAETAIGGSPAAFVQAGATLAEQVLGDLHNRSVLIVGAGGMAIVAAKHLRDRGVGHLRVVNRNVDRARRLADRAGGEHAGLDSLAPALAAADLVVSSTGATGTVIEADAVRDAVRGRAARPLFLLDLAVPRDVDPDVATIAGVLLADIDDLRDTLAVRDAQATREIERAKDVVAEEVTRFSAWRRAVRLAPIIQALRARGARIQASELARVGPRLAGLSEREREAVQALAEGIVAKLLHDPIVKLKASSAPGRGDSLALAVAELFGLELPPVD